MASAMYLPSDQVTEDDVSLQQVLEASLERPISSDAEKPTGKASLLTMKLKKGQQEAATDHPAQPQTRTIDDCIRDIDINSKHDYRINDALGDTYLFLDPPARQPGQSERYYSLYCQQYKKPFVMRSERLAQVSTLFKELLGPTQQYRIVRRRKLTSSLPPEIKYVLDLTPPSEGDDAVYLTASLCCSEGIRLWHLAGRNFDISDLLVNGTDDWVEPTSQDAIDMPEYSPIRHRSAIEQCLAAIRGNNNIILNSAVKVWSIAILIEYFGISSQECTFLTDSIVTWLRVEPNNYFLEVNCEESLRIATILQNSSIARDVFAVLVGEETLDGLVRERLHKTKSAYSVSGRKKESLSETWTQRVEYATRSFLQSHTADVEDLFTNKLQWVDKILRFHIPKDIKRDAEVDGLYLKLKQALKNYVQVTLYACLFDNSEQFWGLSQPEFGRATPEGTIKLEYKNLWPNERTLTRNFWEKLREEISFWDRGYARFRWQNLSREFYEDTLVRKISATAYENASLGDIEGIIKDGQYRLMTRHKYIAAPSSHSNGTTASQTFQKWLDRTDTADACTGGVDDQQNLKTTAVKTESGNSERPLLSSDANPMDHKFSEISRLFTTPKMPNQGETDEWPAGELSEENDTFDPSSGTKATLDVGDDVYKNQLFFDLDRFWGSVKYYLSDLANKKLAQSDRDRRFDCLNPRLTRTLVNLGESEWKYLPLWAEGLDDETGAIYSEDVMEAAPGSDFSTPGPHIHTGDSTYSASSRGSDYDMMSDAGSYDTTVNLSTAVADGHPNQMFRNKVYTPSSTGSVDSTDQEMAAQAEQERAQLVVRTLERVQASTAEETENVQASEHSRMPAEDACYDDLFSGDFMDEDGDGYASDATERGGENDRDEMDSDTNDGHDDEDEDGVLV